MKPFARLHDRLVEKAKDTRARPVLYVALGDSVTHGYMEFETLDHENVYHAVLRKRVLNRVPLTVFDVINAGAAGETATQSLTRLRRDVLTHQPDLVTVSFGLNDAHAGPEGLNAFTQAITDIAGAIRTETSADLLILTPGMMMKQDNSNIHASDRAYIPAFLRIAERGYLKLYTETLRQLAHTEGFECLDIYPLWERMDEEGKDIHHYLANGLNHPNREIHREMAQMLEDRLFAADSLQ